MKVAYEWCIQTIDEHDDVVDNDFSDKLSTFKIGDIDEKHRLVLVRDEYTDTEGVQDRAWAYPVITEIGYMIPQYDCQLPEFFHDAYQQDTTRVPKKLHEEIRVWNNRNRYKLP